MVLGSLTTLFSWQFYALPQTSKSWIRAIATTTAVPAEVPGGWMIEGCRLWQLKCLLRPDALEAATGKHSVGQPQKQNLRLLVAATIRPFRNAKICEDHLPGAQIECTEFFESRIHQRQFVERSIALCLIRQKFVSGERL